MKRKRKSTATARRPLASVITEVLKSERNKAAAARKLIAIAQIQWDERWFADAHELALAALAVCSAGADTNRQRVGIARWIAFRFPSPGSFLNLGDQYQRAGNEHAATQYWRRALRLGQAQRDRRTISGADRRLGCSHIVLDDIDEAIDQQHYDAMGYEDGRRMVAEYAAKTRRKGRWRDLETLTRLRLRLALSAEDRAEVKRAARSLAGLTSDPAGYALVAEGYAFSENPALAKRFFKLAMHGAWAAGLSSVYARAITALTTTHKNKIGE
ncbi:hypothetical protein [Paraburkholderia sp.]|jgi:tetratricopeptide (TPR) repeat protein|uniref:hypothetical protein n=1 Tax=Paraburkholderia sp. TaxID=1926495 RepID=UPI002F404A70